MQLDQQVVLRNGVPMPMLGFGVWQLQDGREVADAVRTAVEVGYRSFDTASFYDNEAGVGTAIKDSGIARDDIFVTTKVWNQEQGYESTLRAFESSRKKLGLDVIDLYLVHWPVKGKFADTWRALEHLYREGHARAIGVSNFQPNHLRELLETCSVVPMVNQVEFHPLLAQTELRAFCAELGIQPEAWGPLMSGHLDQAEVSALAAKYGKTPAQIVLRWDIQHGVVTIPKSANRNRMMENLAIFDFALSDDDMAQLDAMNRNKRFGADPDNFNF
ncbi:aldo/keto reductase [Paenibacillus rhizovicinus]|uniref:Aldo/keto reductase n=1 Tax=Paenibacillus rhizovicinus TaxID=2704463 RepID=A0A6C0P1U6_9BACL|nr:aldo/keto reductase [Paenibacillus rhizovicinus]QHW32439.1 aldo/keto reductase [Paenibacillus rhizovicinus]